MLQILRGHLRHRLLHPKQLDALLKGVVVRREENHLLFACFRVRHFSEEKNVGQEATHKSTQKNLDTSAALEKPTDTIMPWGAEGVTTLMHQAVKLDSTEVAAATIKNLKQNYLALSAPDRRESLLVLAKDFGVDQGNVKALCEHYIEVQRQCSGYQTAEGHASLLQAERELRKALNPLSGRLFEAIHDQAGGLRFLSDMRADLLAGVRATNDPFLRNLDSVLKEKLSTWLGPAYLELRRLTWDSPASTLAKIAEHEQVHPIRSVQDLQRRLGQGCRLFGFFHPSMPGEPLIFVEVALLDRLAATMQEVAQPQTDEEKARAAIFYSIDSTQPGLSGIDLGHMLLKGVVQILQAELPNLKIFSTLSPVPGFLSWLRPKLSLLASPDSATKSPFAEELLLADEARSILQAVAPSKLTQDITNRTLQAEACGCLSQLLLSDSPDWHTNPLYVDALRGPVMRLCARYLYIEKKRGKALDAVANFHVRNGATVERLNWLADSSPARLRSSAGVMVNFQYRFDTLETNNKAYLTKGDIAASKQFLSILQPQSNL